MQPSKVDEAYLWDMRRAAKEVMEIVGSLDEAEFYRVRAWQLAVERGIEIIGEAANHVSKERRAAIPQIPWNRVIAQRHVIAHEYGKIKYDRIWFLATKLVPILHDELSRLGLEEGDS